MIKELISRYPVLATCENDIKNATNAIIDCYRSEGKLLLCGNGGSASDCDHIVGELMKGFLKRRPICEEKKNEMRALSPDISEDLLGKLQLGLPAVALPSIAALNSAFCNDVEPEYIYAQSTLALGKKGDILIAMSTSGNAKNVYAAALVAKALGMTVISLTGESGGRLKEIVGRRGLQK